METPIISDEVLVCQTCGDQGFTNAFIYCVRCLGYVIHRYCLAVMPDTYDEFVTWYCDDCEPPPPYQFTSPPRKDPPHSQDDDPPNAPLVKTTHPKKKQKKKSLKRKLTALVASGEDNKCVSRPNRLNRCVVLGLGKPQNKSFHVQEKIATSSHVKTTEEVPLLRKDDCVETPSNVLLKEAPVNSDSGANQITPQSAELDNFFSTEGIVRRKRDTIRVAAKTEKHKAEKSGEHSSCESSCTDAALKNDDDVTHPEEGSKCRPDQDKFVSNNLSCEKDLNNSTAYACESDYMVTDLQYPAYQPAMPIDVVWRGSFNISQADYDLFEGFVAHISSMACQKVRDEADTLPSMLSLEMDSRAHLWPPSFLNSMPSDEHIGLYFFPDDPKYERDFDQLVDDMIDKDRAMTATSKNAQLLIFTSKVLPQLFWRREGKYYLWGVFRRKRNDDPVENHNGNDVSSTNSGNEVTSEKQTLKRVKSIESHSPQSPLCSYR